MRHTVLALTIAAVGGFASAGCGSGSNNGGGGDMGRDMAGGGGGGGGGMDMAAVKLNCLGIGFCIASCPQGTPVQTCFTMCAKMAKPNSNTKFGNAFNCGQSYCAPDPDSGATAKCVRTVDPTGVNGPLLCAPGQTYAQCMANGPSICNTCLQDAIGDPLLGDGVTPPTGTCMNMSSPDCKGGAMCMSQFAACIGDP